TERRTRLREPGDLRRILRADAPGRRDGAVLRGWKRVRHLPLSRDGVGDRPDPGAFESRARGARSRTAGEARAQDLSQDTPERPRAWTLRGALALPCDAPWSRMRGSGDPRRAWCNRKASRCILHGARSLPSQQPVPALRGLALVLL